MAKKKEIELDPVVIQNKARMDEIVEELKAIEVSEAERKADSIRTHSKTYRAIRRQRCMCWCT